MGLVLIGSYPLLIVETVVARRHVKHDSISVKMVHKYMERFKSAMEKNIARKMPEKLTLVFGGWSIGNTHYCGILAALPVPKDQGYKEVLLDMTPMDEEARLDAEEYKTLV